MSSETTTSTVPILVTPKTTLVPDSVGAVCAAVKWEAVEGAAEYKVQYAVYSRVWSWEKHSWIDVTTPIIPLKDASNEFSVVIAGLAEGTMYAARVAAVALVTAEDGTVSQTVGPYSSPDKVIFTTTSKSYDYDRIYAERENLMRSVSSLHHELDAAKVAAETATRDAAQARQDADTLRTLNDATQEMYKTAVAETDALKLELDQQRAQLALARNEGTAEVAALRTQLREIAGTISERDAALEASAKERADLLNALRAAREQLEGSEREAVTVHELQARLAAMDVDVARCEALQQQNTELRGLLAKAEVNARHHDELITHLTRQAEAARSAERQLADRVNLLERNVADYQELLKNGPIRTPAVPVSATKAPSTVAPVIKTPSPQPVPKPSHAASESASYVPRNKEDWVRQAIEMGADMSQARRTAEGCDTFDAFMLTMFP